MKRLKENEIIRLSFPDFDVRKIDFSNRDKNLKIFLDGAYLDLEEGMELGPGILFFDDWKNFTIRAFDAISDKWTDIDNENFEPLREICEFKFTDSTINLYGFTKHSSKWVEWNIESAKIQAEFEEKNINESKIK